MSNSKTEGYVPRHAYQKGESDLENQDIREWQDGYIKLAVYVTEKGRMPSHRDSGEAHNIWLWANRQNTALMFGLLNDEQSEALLSIPNFRQSFGGK